MMDLALLSESDIKWINDYHHEVLTKVSPLLGDAPDALERLKRNTQPISKHA